MKEEGERQAIHKGTVDEEMEYKRSGSEVVDTVSLPSFDSSIYNSLRTWFSPLIV